MVDKHPEDFCDWCGHPNVAWSAPNDLWNRVVRGPNGILCPACFSDAVKAEGLEPPFFRATATGGRGS